MPGEDPAEDAGAQAGRAGSSLWSRWWVDLPVLLSRLAESYLRDSMVTGTVVVALVVAVGGLLSGSVGPAVTGVVVGVGGAVLLIATVARRRSPARQWLTMVVVLAVEIALIVVWTA